MPSTEQAPPLLNPTLLEAVKQMHQLKETPEARLLVRVINLKLQAATDQLVACRPDRFQALQGECQAWRKLLREINSGVIDLPKE
jgi:hypothetical protein